MTYNYKIKKELIACGKESQIPGISGFFNSESLLIKFAYLSCSIIFGSTFICFSTKALTDYINYPVTTKIRYETEKKVVFPGVTFCNTNPFVTDYATTFLLDYLQAVTNRSFDPNLNLTIKEYIYERLLNNRQYKTALQVNAFNQNDTERQKFGMTLNETLISCMFKSQPCDFRNFTWKYDIYYGNCFSFNSVPSDASFINTAGTESALVLELFIGHENNSVPFYGGRGLQIAI